MTEAGVLTPEDRVELIDGEILTVTPQSSAHATGVSLVHDALRVALGHDVHIRVQLPLALGADSEPEPDVAVVAGSIRDYREAHPHSALLVIEVADTTLAYDRDVKGSVYARAAVPEYWIVNLAASLVEVYRDPAVTLQARFGWHYASSNRFRRGDSIQALSVPGGPVSVTDLLP